jgi:hypothetical protein
MAVKAISDESTFAMPPLDRFVNRDGQFCQTAFAASLGARPWLWSTVFQLARNSAKASRALCVELDRCISGSKVSGAELHPVTRVVN